ncbi:MAG: ribokinase [Acetobacteraceae bacterium]|nr:ribokinase [Acetobacteraceae bacterium]
MSRVFVLGNASLDTTLRVPRLPVAGETLMATGIVRSPGGKGLNQAVVAARAGAQVHFLAPLGTEPETALIRDALAREALAECSLVDAGAPTDLSSLMVAPDGENCIVSTGACCDALGEAVALAFVAGMRAGDILLMQGNLTEKVTLAAMLAARDRRARVMLNTAPLRWDYRRVLAQCDLVVANRHEALSITGAPGAAEAGRVLAALGPRQGQDAGVIITLGAQGCLASGEQGGHHPALKVAVVDSTGAGDTFCGMLAAMWATRPAHPFRWIDAAQRAAARTVSRQGCFASFPSPAELAEIVLETQN